MTITPRRVLFGGDWHGNADHATWVFTHAVTVGADQIVVCGDFGYWPHYHSGERFLDQVEHHAARTGIPVWFVDGNHENHDWLDALPRDGDGLVTISPHLRYVPRGTRWAWGDVTFLGHGGAWSVDWKYRTEGESWWKQELVTPAQIAAVSAEPVDVLVTHEAPFGANLSYKDDLPVSVAQRYLIRGLVDKISPRLVVSGHHHVRNTFFIGDTQVEVLNRDTYENESVLLLDLARWKERHDVVHSQI